MPYNARERLCRTVHNMSFSFNTQVTMGVFFVGVSFVLYFGPVKHSKIHTAALSAAKTPHQTPSDRLKPKENKGWCLLSQLSPFNISFVTPSGITAGDCGRGKGGSKGSARDRGGKAVQTKKVAEELNCQKADRQWQREQTDQRKAISPTLTVAV